MRVFLLRMVAAKNSRKRRTAGRRAGTRKRRRRTISRREQPITTNDVKKAINLRNRLQRVRQKMSVASATDITSGPERSTDA
jgi:hypothetical protein